MKAERNIITIDKYGQIHFPNVSNNDVWMSTNELMDLFGVIYPTLKANIRSIYKSGILNECEVQKAIILSNGIRIDVYALPMILALSFRLDTMGAYKVREYFISKLTTNSRNQFLFLNVRTHERMNENRYDYN